MNNSNAQEVTTRVIGVETGGSVVVDITSLNYELLLNETGEVSNHTNHVKASKNEKKKQKKSKSKQSKSKEMKKKRTRNSARQDPASYMPLAFRETKKDAYYYY
ncbi:hypothetical protein ACOSQ2_001435 [Xanthoceras sorbifolium]